MKSKQINIKIWRFLVWGGVVVGSLLLIVRWTVIPERRVCFQDSSCVWVRLADTPGEIRLGLSGKRWMHGEVGMLFTFDQLGQYGFWMKDMRMDLDFVWLREGEIVDLTENVPAPKETFEELTVYQATVPIDSVLEFRAGWVERNGIELGDRLLLK